MLDRSDNYATLYENFQWQIPEFYNIGVDVCDRLAEEMPDNIAIIDIDEADRAKEITFSQLRNLSNQLANALIDRGVTNKGHGGADRIGVLLPQCLETAVSHIAIFKMGCISVPLFTLFGEDALLHRLQDSGASAVITNEAGVARLQPLLAQLPQLSTIVSIDGPNEQALDFHELCATQSQEFKALITSAEDPALLIYTSGTTGKPKGALHAHRVLLGHLPGVEIAFNFLPASKDRFWTPADWAWIGGLLDVLLPALHHGIPVVAHRFSKFDPRKAFELMEKYQVRNVFLPPTALKLMRKCDDAQSMNLQLRSVASGGETLGAELLEWSRHTLGTDINEFYGQTECNMIISCCSALEPITPGVMGRAVVGHRVDIINSESGVTLADNIEGAIAVRAPDPVMFLRYWNNESATQAKFVEGQDGRWLLTGDTGVRLKNGKIRFIGRDDDIINSAGYRIGPAEIENCLIKHPAVQLAGVVGKPDAIRGSLVTAFLTLVDGVEPSDELAEEIAEFVKQRLAAHEYPRIVRFVQAMPMTTTGKIIRAELRQLAEND